MKTKIKNTVVLFFIATIPFCVFSQDKKEKVKSMKVAYITNELNLTTSESEKFWPIYNEMDDKLRNIRKEIKTSIDEMQNKSESLSEDDYKKNIQVILNSESQENSIKKEYFNKIGLAIGFKKTAKLMKAEKEFRAVLLEEMKGKPNQKQKGAKVD